MADEATTTTPATNTPAAEQPTNTTAAEQKPQGENKGSNIEELIQKAVDRATNKLGNENKKLRGEIESLRKAGMDAEELQKFELSEKEKEIAEREKALTDKENRLTAIKAIKEAGEIVDLVMAEDEKGIKERVTALNNLVTRLVKSQVEARFKDAGRTPGVGTDTASNAGGENDYATRSGKIAAASNQKSRSILDSYGLGGK